MAHLNSIREAILATDDHYAVDITALNNSGVSGTVLATLGDDTLSVAVVARGLTPEAAHVQHVHGRFDESGEPAASVPPTGAEDTDLDGFVEVMEGAAAYGDILLPLEDQSDGLNNDPAADAEGVVTFYEEYDLTDDSLFLNPLSGTQYEGADLLALPLREYVIHGLQVDRAVGAGTVGSIDGTTGYKVTLPVGAGAFESVSEAEALDRLEDLITEADPGAVVLEGTPGDDVFELAQGPASVFAGEGTDTLRFDGSIGDVAIAADPAAGTATLTGTETGAATRLASVERVEFDDATVLFGLGAAAETAYLTYAAGLGRTPEEDGLRFWAGQMEEGLSPAALAREVAESEEFAMRFGTGLSDAAYVDVLYANVLGREAGPEGAAFWQDALARPGFDRADALVAFADSPENRAQEADSLGDGFILI
jgi:hypothetical protein